MQVVAAEPSRSAADMYGSRTTNDDAGGELSFTISCVSIARMSPPVCTAMFCVGHPGSGNLKVAQNGDYDVMHVSLRVFCGHAIGQDVQDNPDIGALQHDCRTPWSIAEHCLYGRLNSSGEVASVVGRGHGYVKGCAGGSYS